MRTRQRQVLAQRQDSSSFMLECRLARSLLMGCSTTDSNPSCSFFSWRSTLSTCSLAAAELYVSWCCLGQLGLLPVDGFFQFREILHVVAGDWSIRHEREAKQDDVWNDS